MIWIGVRSKSYCKSCCLNYNSQRWCLSVLAWCHTGGDGDTESSHTDRLLASPQLGSSPSAPALPAGQTLEVRAVFCSFGVYSSVVDLKFSIKKSCKLKDKNHSMPKVP